MKKEVFELSMWLLQQHREADLLLAQRKLPCVDKNGNLTGWEFDKIPFYQAGMRFIGLGMYQHLWNNPEWKEAYKFLTDNGYLLENPEHSFHFQYLPQDPEWIQGVFESDKLRVPFELRAKYNDYIKSQEWKDKCDKILARDNHECQHCHAHIPDLSVHHKTYENLFNEKDEDLITLCDSCHKKEHGYG